MYSNNFYNLVMSNKAPGRKLPSIQVKVLDDMIRPIRA